MKRFWILGFVILEFSASPALAVTKYVDGSLGSDCLGSYNTGTRACSGGAATAYKTVRSAIRSSLSPGDHIQIRSGTYDENASTLAGSSDGANGNNIVVEPFTAETPILRYTVPATVAPSGASVQAAALQLEDVNYWTVQNLTFDGNGTYTSMYAIWVRANLENVTGNKVIGNTVQHWGGTDSNCLFGVNNCKGVSGISIQGRQSAAFYPDLTTIQGNTVTDVRRSGIAAFGKVHRVDFIGNTISSIKEGRESGSSTVNVIGYYFGLDVVGPLNFTGANVVHDFQSFASTVLTAQGNAVWAGLWADANTDNGNVTGMTVYNIGQGKTDTSNSKGTSWQAIGIIIESRCDNWNVRENRVFHIGTYGMRNGSVGTTDPNGNQWINNVVYDYGVVGLLLNRGSGLMVKNNAFIVGPIATASVRAIEFISCPMQGSNCTADAGNAGGNVVDYNDYFGSSVGDTKVARWANSSVGLTFAQLKTNLAASSDWSGDEAHGLNVTPAFVSTTNGSEDFHLAGGSGLIDTGEAGVDIGAYPTFDTAPPVQITVITPNGGEFYLPGETVHVTWQANDTGDFDISMTKDGGVSYKGVAQTSNDTSYDFVMPQGASSQCKIKVASHASPSSLDTSDNYFRSRGFYTGAQP